MTPWGAPDLAEVKAALRIDAANTDDDLTLDGYRLSAIRLVEDSTALADWRRAPNLKTAVILIVARWYDDDPGAGFPPLAQRLIDISRTGWIKA